MLIKRPQLISRECAWSQKINDLLPMFGGRGHVLTKMFLPGTAGRVLKADGGIEDPTSQLTDADGSQINSSTHFLEPVISGRARIGDRGLLVEGERTDLLPDGKTNFDVATTGWANSVGTVGFTSNTDVAPDGTTTADTLEDNATGSREQIAQDIAVANDTVIRTIALSIKKTSGATTFPMINLVYDGATSRQTRGILNTNTGVATIDQNTGTAGTVNVESDGDYWRISIMKANSDGNTNLRFIIGPAFSSNGTSADTSATGTSVVWGAQAEVSEFASSYIFTAAALRATDDIQYSNSSEVLIEGAQGTIVVGATPEYDAVNLLVDAFVFDVLTGDSDDGMRIVVDKTANQWNWQGKSGGTLTWNLMATTSPARGIRHLLAGTWDNADFRIFVNGIQEGIDSAGDAPTTTNPILFVGNNANLLTFFGLLASLIITRSVLIVSQIQQVNSRIRRWIP